MKLVMFEWKKILYGKIRWILIALFCLNLGAYYMYTIPMTPTAMQKEARQKWEKALADREEDIESDLQFLQKESEKILMSTDITEEMDPSVSADLWSLEHLEQEYYSVLSYRQFIGDLKERAYKMNEFVIFNKEGGFAKRNIEKTVKDFERVEKIEIYPTDDTGMAALHKFYLTDILMILITCLFCFQEYGGDEKSGMGNLIQVTPKGKGWLRLAQMQAVGLSVIISGILLYGTDLLVTGYVFGFGNLSYYIQGMKMFRNVSFPCTIGMYLVLYFVWKIVALLFVSIVFQFFAVQFNGRSVAWFLSGIGLVISFGLWFFLPNSPTAKMFRYLNLMGILDVGQIVGNYQNLKVFQYPVFLLYAAILFMLLLGGAFVCGILLVKRKEVRVRKIELPTMRSKKTWNNPFSYEVYKITVNQKAWVILLVLFVVSIFFTDTGTIRMVIREHVYENEINNYIGEYTDEKMQKIEEIWERQEIEDVEARLGFEQLYNQTEYLKNSNASNKGFVNLRVLKDFFLFEDQEIKNLLFVVIAVMLSVSGLYYQDKKKQMDQLLYTTPKSRRIYWDKVKIAALTGGISAFVVWSVTYLKYFHRFDDIEGLSFSIQSIPEFAEMGYHGSIRAYMIIVMLLRIIIGIYIGIVIGFLSQILIVPTQNVICVVLLFVVPLSLSYVGQMGYENSLTTFINQYMEPVLRPVKLLAKFPSVWFQTKSWKLGLFMVIPVACVVTGLKLWEKKRK